MSARPSYRLFQASRTFFRQPLLRRRINTAAQPEIPAQTGFARVWNSKVGPKTVHFWAPIMKWALVLTGVSDFYRPAESLSLTQNAALMATGAIWTRWCFIIKPQNLFLAAVNFFLFLVGSTQVTRIMMYRQSLADEPLAEQAKAGAIEAKETVVAKTEEVVDSAKKIVGK